MNLRRKDPFGPLFEQKVESVEDFLKRGGRIQKLPPPSTELEEKRKREMLARFELRRRNAPKLGFNPKGETIKVRHPIEKEILRDELGDTDE